jgi:CheY-like chemotaxis protein
VPAWWQAEKTSGKKDDANVWEPGWWSIFASWSRALLVPASTSRGASMRRRTMLLIASNPQEVRLSQQTFEHAGPHHTLRVVHDGEEALAYLRQEGVYTDSRRALRPDVIVLDLQLPQLTGQELLQRLKQDQQLKRLPIIVLTTPMGPDEVRQAYGAGANAYLRKPTECLHFAEVVDRLGRFWLETVELPPDA